jgi:sec-independent protein translocase protein TatB
MTTQLREDIGPDFDDLREPLSELQKLRGMTPRAALTKHLFDGDDSLFTGRFDTPSVGPPDSVVGQPATPPMPSVSPATESPAAGPAPFDTDAT